MVLNFRVRVICLHAASILLPQLERVGINPYQLSGAVLSPECPLFTLLNCKKQRTAYDKWQNKPQISAQTGTSSKKCFRASAPKWPLGPSLATLGDNHIITSGKIRPFLTSNSYTFSPWRPTDFEDLESLPLSLTSHLQSPQQVLKTTQPSTATSGASRRSKPQAARIIRRQWEGPVHQLSWDQNPLRVIDPLRIVSDATCPPQCVMELLAYSPASPAPCIVQ